MSRYDPNELRRCLTFAFSPSELDELARSVGVYPAPRSGAGQGWTDETARLLVNMLSRRGQLGELVERLRAEKPLVEWPQPLPAAEEVRGPTAAASAGEPERPLPVSSRAPDSADQALGTAPVGDPLAPTPPAGRHPLAAPAAADERVAHRDEAEAADEPGGPATPSAGAGRSWAEAPRGLDEGEDDQTRARRRRLQWAALAGIAVAALIAAVVGAFAAGRASSSGGGATEPARDGAEPARLAEPAAAELKRAVQAVAEACALPDSRGPAKEVLARAFQSCAARGKDQAALLRAHSPTPSKDGSENDAAAAEPPRDGPPPPRPAAEPAPRGSGCLQRCDQLHDSCKSRECGPEPTKGSDYADYQRCLSKCLRKASQCRMRCG